MAQYNKWIKSNDEDYEFWFTEIFEKGIFRIYVTVEDEEQNLHSFIMKKNENNSWKITKAESVTSWILDVEEELSNVIKEGKPR